MKVLKSFCIALVLLGLGLAAFGQTIRVTAPAGGERLALGNTINITWTASGVSGNVRINLIDRGGAVVGPIIGRIEATRGSHSWEVGDLGSATADIGENYRIRVRAIDSETAGESGSFAIVEAADRPIRAELRLTAPNGGQTWFLGSPQRITWSYAGFPDSVLIRLDLYKDGRDEVHRLGTIVSNLAIGSGGTGWYNWSPGVCQEGTAPEGRNRYYVKVSCMEGAEPDFSDSAFTISAPIELQTMMQAQRFTPPAPVAPTIEVPTPLAPLTITHPFTINWAARGVSGNLAINLIKEPGDSYPIATDVSPGLATGHYTWNIGQLATGGSYLHAVEGARFRFQITGRGAVGLSRWFEIRRPSLAVTEPHSGQRLRRGDRTTIRWSAPDLRGDVKIEAQSRVLPGGFYRTYETLSAAAPNLGRREWTIWPRPRAGSADLDPPPSGDNVRWRIFLTSVRNPQIVAASDDFIIE